jgi:imidazolonepropionase-like amidohydrolase
MNGIVFLSILVLPGPLIAQTEQKPQPKPLAITHVTVIDCTGTAAQSDMTVIVTSQRITALGKAKDVAVPEGAQVIDGTGKFLIPGLWDMHAHWYGAGIKAYLPLFTANGVTGLRIMRGWPGPLAWRKEVTEGSLLGPRLVVAGNLVDGPNPTWHDSSVVTTEKEGRKAVQTTKKDGYDFVKVYGGVPEDAYYGIAAEAKILRMPFAGHVPGSVGAALASDMGQKSFEHLWDVALSCSGKEEEQRAAYLADLAKSPPTDQGATDTDNVEQLFVYTRNVAKYMDSYDEKKAAVLFARFVKNETWQVPTLTMWRFGAYVGDKQFTEDPRLKYLPPATRESWAQAVKDDAQKDIDFERVFRTHLALVSSMHKAGVPLLAGTDVDNPFCFPGFGMHDELALMVAAGLSPMAALQTATSNPAKYLGREKASARSRRGSSPTSCCSIAIRSRTSTTQGRSPQ